MYHRLRRLQKLNYFIAKANTGTPAELAKKLHISEAQLYLDLGVMKNLGAPIEYCRMRTTYYYTKEGCFNMGFEGF